MMKTIAEIAKEIGCSKLTITYWIDKLNLAPVYINKKAKRLRQKGVPIEVLIDTYRDYRKRNHSGSIIYLDDAQIDRIRQARS